MADFARVVSHDFCGPLRVIRGFAAILEEALPESGDRDMRQHLGEIIIATNRMQALTDGLVTCIRARSAPLELSDVSLESILSGCLAALASRIHDQGAQVTHTHLPVVRSDAATITVVFHHLLDNALRYTAPGRAPMIRVAAARSATEWTITVRDNGPGIAASSREPAFALFKRLDVECEPGRPGVGLTLCRTIVERHGGHLWIDGSAGGGAEATFTLPIGSREAPGEESGDVPARCGLGEVTGAPPLQTDSALAAIVAFSDDAMFSKDLNGVILTWNRAAETLYGYSAGEAIGQHVSMLMPPDEVIELPALLDAVRRGVPTHIETVRRCKSGRLIDISLMISPIRDAQGGIVAAAVTARDVTERHRIDEDARAFLEVAPDAIVVIDGAGDISAANSQAQAIFGYTRDELVGQPLEMLLPERFRGAHVTHRVGFTADPKHRPMGVGLPLFARRRDGSEFPVDIQLSSLPTKNGILPVAAIRDVTERRRLEHLRDAFIGNAAHELRTPLTTLAGLGETLARNFDRMARTDIEDAFAAMERQGDRAKVLIANLLDISDVEGGRVRFVVEAVDVRLLIDRVLEAAPPPADKTVVVTVPAALRVLADPGRLEQVFSNLLVNSYRYGGDAIRVCALAQGGQVIISVTDDGAGIAPDFVPTLFEPFTRGKESNVVRGSGIGLALCRRIVQNMGANIWYEPLLPRGSSFRVSLAEQA